MQFICGCEKRENSSLNPHLRERENNSTCMHEGTPKFNGKTTKHVRENTIVNQRY